ncbi:MAG TPA: NAD(P)-binding domain-containing protein [Gemmatimonadaceae bacterium]
MRSSSISPPRTATRVERFETVVIGGGQAGLAVGHHLAERGVDFVILSDESRVGDNWRRRWDSLRLFTPARFSGLPGMPFPAPSDHLPDKDEVADYLERYAARFELPVRAGMRVRSMTWDGTRYLMAVDGGTSLLEADNVIVATGPFQRPHVPLVSTQLSRTIFQIHSSEYRNPFELPLGPALVVGAGNSGAQIALELTRFRKVWLAGRDTGHLPRRVLGRDVFTWLWPIMLRTTSDTWVGRRMRAGARRRGGDALIGITERDIRQAGIMRVGRLEDARGGLPLCGDAVLEPRVVVWCTGFEPDYDWIDLPIFDDDGRPRHERGVVTDMPGLYFLGLPFQHRLNSTLIGGVGADAAFIAEQVALRCDTLVDS